MICKGVRSHTKELAAVSSQGQKQQRQRSLVLRGQKQQRQWYMYMYLELLMSDEPIRDSLSRAISCYIQWSCATTYIITKHDFRCVELSQAASVRGQCPSFPKLSGKVGESIL